MKTAVTYIFLMLFAFAISYKTLRYFTQVWAGEKSVYGYNVDCESEDEKSVENDEITDNFFDHFSDRPIFLTLEEIHIPKELIVNFISSDYKNIIYSPPDRCL